MQIHLLVSTQMKPKIMLIKVLTELGAYEKDFADQTHSNHFLFQFSTPKQRGQLVLTRRTALSVGGE